jgi:hypothetical protein
MSLGQNAQNAIFAQSCDFNELQNYSNTTFKLRLNSFNIKTSLYCKFQALKLNFNSKRDLKVKTNISQKIQEFCQLKLI